MRAQPPLPGSRSLPCVQQPCMHPPLMLPTSAVPSLVHPRVQQPPCWPAPTYVKVHKGGLPRAAHRPVQQRLGQRGLAAVSGAHDDDARPTPCGWVGARTAQHRGLWPTPEAGQEAGGPALRFCERGCPRGRWQGGSHTPHALPVHIAQGATSRRMRSLCTLHKVQQAVRCGRRTGEPRTRGGQVPDTIPNLLCGTHQECCMWGAQLMRPTPLALLLCPAPSVRTMGAEGAA